MENECTPCSPGFDCTELGLRTPDNYKCPPGYFCEGSNQPRKECPASYFRESAGGDCDITGVDGCTEGCKECPEGTFCPRNRSQKHQVKWSYILFR